MSISIADRDYKDSQAELARVLRGRSLSDFERQLVDVLHDDIFRRPDDLRSSELCALSYRRLRYLHERIDLSIETLEIERMLALHEWVALIDGTLATLLTIHFNLCIGSILEHGCARPELQPFLDELDRLDSVGVFLATELGYGNNVQALETEAIYDHAADEFVIHTPSAQAQKFMPNTAAEGIAKLAVVMARLKVSNEDCGVFPFIVRIRTADGLCEGVTVTALGDKPDYALDNAITSFDRVRIPRHHWLSGNHSRIDERGAFSSSIASRRQRFLLSIDRVQAGKLCLGVSGLAFMCASLQLTLGYARQRKTFAPGRTEVSILDYKPYQRALLEGVSTAYACSLLLRYVARRYRDRQSDELEVNRLLAIVKTFVSSRGLQITALCRERIGAQGLFSANRIISYWIQTNAIVTAEGDNEVLLIKTARELLLGSDYQPPRVRVERTSGVEALAVDNLLAIIADYESRLHQRLGASMAGALAGPDLFDVWNDNLHVALELASVHTTRIALQCFIAAARDARASSIGRVLDRVLHLFALGEFAALSAALIVEGIVDVSTVAACALERARLASRLSPDAQLLVDAFGLPDSLLGAPIAGDYIAAYDRLKTRSVTQSGIVPIGETQQERTARGAGGA